MVVRANKGEYVHRRWPKRGEIGRVYCAGFL